MAVLLDVTLIRTLVVPSLMALMGRWNWWLPDVLRPLAGRGLQHETVDERA
jgi:RND superfamily putative drug exporter